MMSKSLCVQNRTWLLLLTSGRQLWAAIVDSPDQWWLSSCKAAGLTNIAREADRKKNYTHTPEMSDMWWPSQKHEETKKKLRNQRPLPKSIAKPLRKPKKTKNKKFSHTMAPGVPWSARKPIIIAEIQYLEVYTKIFAIIHTVCCIM